MELFVLGIILLIPAVLVGWSLAKISGEARKEQHRAKSAVAGIASLITGCLIVAALITLILFLGLGIF